MPLENNIVQIMEIITIKLLAKFVENQITLLLMVCIGLISCALNDPNDQSFNIDFVATSHEKYRQIAYINIKKGMITTCLVVNTITTRDISGDRLGCGISSFKN